MDALERGRSNARDLESSESEELTSTKDVVISSGGSGLDNSSFKQLPEEIVCKIFQMLSNRELIVPSLVCRFFYHHSRRAVTEDDLGFCAYTSICNIGKFAENHTLKKFSLAQILFGDCDLEVQFEPPPFCGVPIVLKLKALTELGIYWGGLCDRDISIIRRSCKELESFD